MTNTRTALDLNKENIKRVKAVAMFENKTLSAWVEEAIVEKLNRSVMTSKAYQSLATPATMAPIFGAAVPKKTKPENDTSGAASTG